MPTFEEYEDLAQGFSVKFPTNEVNYREAKGEEFCLRCIHYFTNQARSKNMCEVVRPYAGDAIQRHFVCSFFTKDGVEYPLLESEESKIEPPPLVPGTCWNEELTACQGNPEEVHFFFRAARNRRLLTFLCPAHRDQALKNLRQAGIEVGCIAPGDRSLWEKPPKDDATQSKGKIATPNSFLISKEAKTR